MLRAERSVLQVSESSLDGAAEICVRRLRELQNQRVKLALDLLEFEEPVTKAMWYACGNTLVTDTLDQAKELAYGDQAMRVKVRWRILRVLDGNLLGFFDAAGLRQMS